MGDLNPRGREPIGFLTNWVLSPTPLTARAPPRILFFIAFYFLNLFYHKNKMVNIYKKGGLSVYPVRDLRKENE